MVFFDEMCHVLQYMFFFFTCAVWSCPSLALAHAHSSPGRVEAQADLPEEADRTQLVNVIINIGISYQYWYHV